jgi:hypothetical protein
VEWKRLYAEEFYDLYLLPNIIWVIKSRAIRWAGHVALMGRREMHTGFWCGSLRERDHFEDLGVDGRNYNESVRSGMGK